MNYLTNYYKNLCEQLQEKLNILETQLNESGVKQALRTENPQQVTKEILKGYARRKRAQNDMEAIDLAGTMQRHGASSKEAGRAKASQDKLETKIRNIDLNLNSLEDADLRNLTPNAYDGPDEDSEGSSAEVIDAQQQNQMTGPLTSSPLETSGMFPDMSGMLSRLTIRKK